MTYLTRNYIFCATLKVALDSVESVLITPFYLNEKKRKKYSTLELTRYFQSKIYPVYGVEKLVENKTTEATISNNIIII